MNRGAAARSPWRALAVAAMCAVAPAAAASAESSPYVLRIDLSADIRNLGSDDPFVSEAAADHLAALGPVVLPVLASALGRESADRRAAIVAVVQQIEGEAATRLLIEAADDRDAPVRADALLALGLRKDAAGAAVVERHLSDANPRARRAAALACNSLCTSPAALARLVTIALHEDEAPAAQQSLRTIIETGAPAAATAAREAIAAQALPLLSAVDVDPSLRLNAAMVAAVAGRREAVPVLVAATAPPANPALLLRAVLALGAIAAPESVAALATLARSGDAGTRNAACVGLAQLRTSPVAGAAAAAAACHAATPTPPQEPR